VATSKRRTALWLWLIMLVVVAAVLAAVGLAVKYAQNADERMFTRGELSMRGGETAEAIKSFRGAIERNPNHLDARRALVRALLERKEFGDALGEIEKATDVGLSEKEAALLTTRVHASRGMYRLESAGGAITAALCGDVVAKDFDPAIALVAESVRESKSSDNYHRLGILCTQKAKVLFTRQQLLTGDLRHAQKVGDAKEVAKLEQQVQELTPEIRVVQQRAMGAFEAAIRVDPEGADDSRLAMAESLLVTFIPQVGAVRALLKPLVETDNPHPLALHLMARAEKEAGRTEAALAYVGKLRDIGEDPKSFRLMEATFLTDLERWNDAEAIVDELLAEQPRNANASYLKGRILMARDRSDEAIQVLQNIFTGASRHWAQARFLLAQALLENDRREQAITAFQDTLSDIETVGVTNIRGRYELRNLQYRTCSILARELLATNPILAAEFGRRAFLAKPEEPEALENARAAYRAADMERAIRDLVAMHAAARAVREGPEAGLEALADESEAIRNDPRIRVLKGRFLMRSGAFRNAAEVLAKLREDYPKELVYAHELAALEYQLGHLGKAKDVYEDILVVDPADRIALGGVIRVLAQQGNLEEARGRLKSAETVIGKERIRSALVGLYLSEGRPQDALPLVRAQIEAEPDNAGNHVALADLLWLEGNIEEARKAYDKAIQLAPENPDGYRRGLLDLQEGHYAEAAAVFKAATKALPRYPAAWLNYAIALQSSGEAEQAIDILRRIAVPSQKYTSLLDQPRWVLALTMAGEGNPSDALEVNRNIIGDQMGIAQERAVLLKALAALQEPARRRAAASLTRLVAFVNARALHAGQNEVKTLEEAIPDAPLPACWIPLIRAELGQYNEAIKELRALVERHPEFPQGYVYLGVAYARNGELDAAARVMEQALQMADKDYVPALHLELGKILESHGQYDGALSHYHEALANPALAAQANNNIAWVTATVKDQPREALVYAERAAGAAPNVPAILDTLGWIHFLNGEAEKAQAPLESAKAGLPANPTVRYHLGAVYHRLGQTDKAIAELKEALALTPDFPEAEKSRMLLERMGVH